MAAAAQRSDVKRKIAQTLVCDWVVDDFTTTQSGRFPKGWSAKKGGERALAEKTYRVLQHAGRHVLHATFQSEAVTIGRKLPASWDPQKYPVLQWEWSALQLPVDADEGSSGRNDCAASVYAFWRIGFPFYVDSLKYSWSSTRKVGSFLDKALGHQRVIVRQTGRVSSGVFRTARADLVEDHKRAFDKEFRLPTGIAVLTDADDTSSNAEAYYANFRLCRYVQKP